MEKAIKALEPYVVPELGVEALHVKRRCMSVSFGIYDAGDGGPLDDSGASGFGIGSAYDGGSLE